MFADGSLGVRCIWWLLQCSHLMVPLCLVVCPVGARLTAVCRAALCPAVLLHAPPPPTYSPPAGYSILDECRSQRGGGGYRWCGGGGLQVSPLSSFALLASRHLLFVVCFQFLLIFPS